MTDEERTQQQQDADLLGDLAEDLELNGEAGDMVRGGVNLVSKQVSQPQPNLLSKQVQTDLLSKH
jgi:hypothetical protein